MNRDGNRSVSQFPRKLGDGAPTSRPTIRSFQESDRPDLEALWTVVFPDDPPRNAPSHLIDNKLRVQPELLLVATGDEGHEGTDGRRASGSWAARK